MCDEYLEVKEDLKKEYTNIKQFENELETEVPVVRKKSESKISKEDREAFEDFFSQEIGD
ncbi:MAG: hypothetical protein EU544_04695 [Promethearchaeota archaeon]|nr:MAG: hypothetical protein EU544_04695 [Candidatus Lokiarchaeota archaeon]